MGGDATSYEMNSSALGLLAATFADGNAAGAMTNDYLAGVVTDRNRALDLAAGMTALATILVQMRSEEHGVEPAETLAELGRRIRGALPGC